MFLSYINYYHKVTIQHVLSNNDLPYRHVRSKQISGGPAMKWVWLIGGGGGGGGI